jgi:transposase
VIPERKDQREQRQKKGSRGGRPPKFERELYRARNVVERCVNRLKRWRGIATRYAKRAQNYLALLLIAAAMIWLRS